MSYSRRDMLSLGTATVAGVAFPGMVQAEQANGPQPGDLFVAAAAGDKAPLRADAILRGAAPTLAWPMDRATSLVRNGTRLNQVLLLRIVGKAAGDGARPDGRLVAFSAICPHAGCLVSDWIAPIGHLHCPCHGSEYDPATDGVVVGGPAPQPLPELPVTTADGLIIVIGGFSTPPGGHTSRTM